MNRRSVSRVRDARGVSMVEVIVALVIFAIVQFIWPWANCLIGDYLYESFH